MSKRITPAKSAAAKRAAFSNQRQQFSAKGRAKCFGSTEQERLYRDEINRAWGRAWGIGRPPVASWTAI